MNKTGHIFLLTFLICSFCLGIHRVYGQGKEQEQELKSSEVQKLELQINLLKKEIERLRQDSLIDVKKKENLKREEANQGFHAIEQTHIDVAVKQVKKDYEQKINFLKEKERLELEYEKNKNQITEAKRLKIDSALKAQELVNLKLEAAIQAKELEAQKAEKEKKHQEYVAYQNQTRAEQILANRNIFIFSSVIFLLFSLSVVITVMSRRSARRQRNIRKQVEKQAKDLREINAILEKHTQELDKKNHILQELTEELRTSEEELTQNNEELQTQREFLEKNNQELKSLQLTKDLMISAVNHDLRNPLNPILNYSNPQYPEKNKLKLLELIHERAKTMFALINDIMDVYRAEKIQLNPQPNSIWKSANEAIQVISEAKEDLPLIINEIPEPLHAIFEYSYIERVFENLLSNAIKYSESAQEGGKIVFRHEFMEYSDKTWVRLLVCDNGIGIPDDKLEEIFKPFVNLQARHIGAAKSVGIGLTFCKTILEAHGSNIGVKSKEGEGSVFYFDLPYANPPIISTEKENIDYEQDTNYHLKESDKVQMAEAWQKLRAFQHEIYNDALQILVDQLNFDQNSDLFKWKLALQKAIDDIDEVKFNELLAELEINFNP